jgi:hypothetical protein
MADIGTRVVQVPFQKGVNTRADKRAVEAPALTWAQNVVLDTEGVLRKRHGYAAISNDDPRVATVFDRCDGIAEYRNGIAAFAGEGHIWSRVAQADDLLQAEVGFAAIARTVNRSPLARKLRHFRHYAGRYRL